MTTDSTGNAQTWAPPLRNLLQGFADQAPRPLLPTLALFHGAEVSEVELLDFIRSAPPNSNALVALRLAFAKWDASTDLELLDGSGAPTSPGTSERRVAIVTALGLSDEAERVIRDAIPIHSDRSIVISRIFEPWYEATRHERSTLYWDDYERYLAETKRWPADAIATLDQSSTSVVERLTDPTRTEIKATRGLVVGYVQSGKTANFTGVIAKAIDAGYRLVVVMTGTIEILRAQTQRRIDMELMGVENVLGGLDPNDPAVAKDLDYQQDEDWVAHRFIAHTDAALDQPGVARIRRVTTHRHDYKTLPGGIAQLRFSRTDKAQPLNAPINLFGTDAYVVVVKKNSAPLKKLIRDLKPLQQTLLELPALIIDDESDVASVNTKNPKKTNARTMINKLITELIGVVPRAQYVGYTATPFANVFIDPDDDEDLFPSDFVLSLPRPTEYMGVQDFHDVNPDWDNTDRNLATSNELAFVRAIKADPDQDPDGRIKELGEALDAWVLTGIIKKYREANGSGISYRHHTMLVHEDVRKEHQSNAAADLRTLWAAGKFTQAEGLDRLKQLFEDDFLPVMHARADGPPIPKSFNVLKPFVGPTIAEMTSGGPDPVLIVNSDKNIQEQQETLDFDAKRVWRVLVGGAKLSRGFTVEGLTISYYRRTAGQADTLMQAGRWFGFRTHYRDLVRLYIRRDAHVDLYEAFEALLLDEEAFRDELDKYAGLDEDGRPLLEPRQVPAVVSQHLPWLRPTARNKMFNAVMTSRARVGAFNQLSSIPERSKRNQHRANLDKVILPLLKKATIEVQLPYRDNGVDRAQTAKVGIVSAKEFLDQFKQLHWHQDYDGVIAPLQAFIEAATADGRIADWAVVWPQDPQHRRMLPIAELSTDAPIWRRSRRQAPRIDFTGENKRNLLAADPVAEGRDVPGLGASHKRGVMVISLVADQDEASQNEPVDRDDVVGLISLRIPDRSVRRRSDLIQWTVRVMNQQQRAVVDKKEVDP